MELPCNVFTGHTALTSQTFYNKILPLGVKVFGNWREFSTVDVASCVLFVADGGGGG